MLNDLERKVLRILYNFSTQRHQMPTKPELERTTGRQYRDIKSALDVLVQERYIFWPDNPRLDTIVILEGWERDAFIPKSKPTIFE
ncbi:hypothetical protein M3201_22055 [Paenibacillus motobuensis]|uniref:hypothetical protein n=1 Tax=Paenibacillus TaxID=44249 RepID=UPI00203A913A|nr:MULTISPECIES: hypothetical protein [Paenibacillus]MCM3042345.1 hypothetical protein [Paenibacillus lutimineralis]MCM3649449.1 hypothetical protein [Paenibacillus motobuensis]